MSRCTTHRTLYVAHSMSLCCNCNVHTAPQCVRVGYCTFHLNHGTVDPDIVHLNRTRSLLSQLTVRENLFEKKYLVATRPCTHTVNSPNAPLTKQKIWRSVQISSGAVPFVFGCLPAGTKPSSEEVKGG